MTLDEALKRIEALEGSLRQIAREAGPAHWFTTIARAALAPSTPPACAMTHCPQPAGHTGGHGADPSTPPAAPEFLDKVTANSPSALKTLLAPEPECTCGAWEPEDVEHTPDCPAHAPESK